VGNGWDWKVGKFVSTLGYEVIERPANMNVTYGLLWQQFPLWYTGVLTSYRFDDYLDAKLGVVNGSNTDNNTTTADNGDGVAVLASLNVTAPGGNANWSNNFQWSTNPENQTDISTADSSIVPVAGSAPGSYSGRMFIYNSWGNWAPKFADDKLLFAFDSVLGNYSSALNNSTWYGAGAYTKYQFNDWFYLAGRAEYLGSNNTGKFGVNGSNGTQANAGDTHITGVGLWEWTLTAGFNVIDNLLIRAEYRLDWGAGSVGGTSGEATNGGGPTAAVSGSGGPAHYAGAEVVYSF
jgi:hypothetical protein